MTYFVFIAVDSCAQFEKLEYIEEDYQKELEQIENVISLSLSLSLSLVLQ